MWNTNSVGISELCVMMEGRDDYRPGVAREPYVALDIVRYDSRFYL